MDEEKDVEEGSESSQDSSTENNSESESVTEDVKKTDSKSVPKSRFDEVNKARKEAEAELARYKSVKQPTKVESNSQIEARLAAVEFMARHKEFDDKDYDAAYAIAKGKGISLEKAIEEDMFKAFAEKRTLERAVNNATPSGGRSPKVTPSKPVSEMDTTEFQEYWKKSAGL